MLRSMATPIETEKVLIFSPHADDEVLGCFSFLSPSCHVVYFGVEDRPEVSRAQRLEEVKASARKSGFQWEALDHTVNAYQAHELVTPMEKVIQRHRPDTVLLPQPSYNQDHRAVYDAAVTALRPHDKNWFVRNVLVFEQPDSILWPHGGERAPNYFRPISIEDKLHSYSLYASQVRGHRSPDLVKALARLRGAQAGHEFAEGYTVKRIVAVQ
ncbi:PIG-L family deacetylase [Aquabacterium sp. A7-Y]|uniref:PIG-L deacetylase family protein n=1 Tax=Aquabacterium sp. A7-Y TaxID=1349605 RepID=UPI00223C9CCA|nr:PIG-L family deacetylase [Aquabacterium sp. A7-Y]MCW7538566.1 PIG-L family deacetylase [Aquabacterium sp. A7-Y]